MCIELDSRLRGNDTGKIMTISKYNNIHPQIAKDVFVAEGAQIIGDVEIASGSSVWFNTVIRGDVNYIRIGERVNVQDLSVIHVESGGHPTLIGDDVTIGHRAIVHACTIGNRCLIGMGAVIMDGAEIADDCIIAAGSLVTEGKKIPAGSVVKGLPGKVVRPVSSEERDWIRQSAVNYCELAQKYTLK
jgi:carbonic anhydrase/acetyltransferase-like protein (isoleucine patch superfamily)